MGLTVRAQKEKWDAPQGKTRGTVKKKLTSETEVGGQKMKASEEDPRYLVEMRFTCYIKADPRTRLAA
jgi:hypothetical protein